MKNIFSVAIRYFVALVLLFNNVVVPFSVFATGEVSNEAVVEVENELIIQNSEVEQQQEVVSDDQEEEIVEPKVIETTREPVVEEEPIEDGEPVLQEKELQEEEAEEVYSCDGLSGKDSIICEYDGCILNHDPSLCDSLEDLNGGGITTLDKIKAVQAYEESLLEEEIQPVEEEVVEEVTDEEEDEVVAKVEEKEESIAEISLADRKSSINEATVATTITTTPDECDGDSDDRCGNPNMEVCINGKCEVGCSDEQGAEKEMCEYRMCSTKQDMSMCKDEYVDCNCDGEQSLADYISKIKGTCKDPQVHAKCKEPESTLHFICEQGTWIKQFQACPDNVGDYVAGSDYTEGDEVCHTSNPSDNDCKNPPMKWHYICEDGTWSEKGNGMCPMDGSVGDYSSNGDYTNGDEVCHTGFPSNETCNPPKEKKKWKCKDIGEGEWRRISDWCSGPDYNENLDYTPGDIVCSYEAPNDNTCDVPEKDKKWKCTESGWTEIYETGCVQPYVPGTTYDLGDKVCSETEPERVDCKEEKVVCDSMTMSETHVHVHDTLQITCAGSNANSFTLYTYKDIGNVHNTMTQSDDDDDDSETFDVTVEEVGEYYFRCMANNANYYPNYDYCGKGQTVYVKEKKICEDENHVEWIEVTSHGDFDEVHTSTIELAGSFEGDVDEVVVTLRGQTRTATIFNGNQWKITLTLVEGDNTIGVYGRSIVGETQCSEKEDRITLFYNKEEIVECKETKLEPKIVTLGNGDFQITCDGLNADQYSLYVKRPSQSQFPDNQYEMNVSGEFTYTPTEVGTYGFRCRARTSTGKEPWCDPVYGEVKEEKKPICDTTTVDPAYPETLTLGNGDFEITCSGEDVEKYTLYVKKPGDTRFRSTNRMAEQTFTYTPDIAGDYYFKCRAWASYWIGEEPYCTIAHGKVIEEEVCEDEDDITSFKITSHSNLDVVHEREIILAGTYEGTVDEVLVRLNQGEKVEADIDTVNKTWSIALVLENDGPNVIGVWAKSMENGEVCDTADKSLKIVYKKKVISTCDDIELEEEIIWLDETFEIECEGTNVDRWKLKVTDPENNEEIIGGRTGQESNEFEVAGEKVGEYWFECIGLVGGEWSYRQDVTSPECETKGKVEEKKVAECVEIKVSKEWINQGEEFTVQCIGNHVEEWALNIKDPEGNEYETAKQTSGLFTIEGEKEGRYWFECLGRPKDGATGGEISGEPCEGDVEVKKKEVCEDEDDITSFKITSHSNLDVVHEREIVLAGTYEGTVDEVLVRLNQGEKVEATIDTVNKTWSIALVLENDGPNVIGVWAKSMENGEVCDTADKSLKIVYKKKVISTCDEIDLEEEVIRLGEDFEIECEGTNVDRWKLKVTDPQGGVSTLGGNGGQESNEFQVEGEKVGEYWFECIGLVGGEWSYRQDITSPECETKGKVKKKEVCEEEDDIISFKITSHSNLDVVHEREIVLAGTYEGTVDEVLVSINGGTNVPADINTANKTWSIPLILDENAPNIIGLWVKSIEEGPYGLEELCDSTEAQLKLVHKTKDICEYPVELTVTSHPTLNDGNGKVIHTTDGKVIIEGTYKGLLDRIMVQVQGIGAVQADVNETTKTWSVEIEVNEGTTRAWVKGVSKENRKCNDQIDFKVTYKKKFAVCEYAEVTPEWIYENGEFTIVCQGDNISKWNVKVDGPGVDLTLPTQEDTNDDDREEFTYAAANVGTYTFVCQGRGEQGFVGEPTCSDTGEVKEDKKEAVCKEITVAPEWINKGEAFTITCEGEHIMKWNVKVDGPGVDLTLPTKDDTNDDDIEVFTYTADTAGTYTFTCQGRAEETAHGEPTCSETGVVKDICVDPVTDVTIDSHGYLDEVFAKNITVSGTFSGDVDTIEVVVTNSNGNTTFAGTVHKVSNTWEADISLEEGGNIIKVTGSSNTPKCGDDDDDTKVIYTPKGVCEDEIESIEITAPQNGITTTQASIQVSGVFSGGVDEVLIRSNSTVGSLQFPAVINGNTWSATVPLYTGFNVVTAIANSDDEDCDPKEDKITIERVKEDICIDPITSLTIDSHTFGEVVTPGTVVISGTVQGGVRDVSVQIEDYVLLADIDGNVWSTTISVGQAGTAFTVRASANDSDCDPKTVQGYLKGEPTTKKSDPAITVECNYNSEISCGDTMSCTAYIINTQGAQAPAENLQAYLDLVAGNSVVSGSILTQVLQGDSLICEKTSDQRVACTGEIAVGSQAEVTFDVKLAGCDCESSNVFVYEGNVQASNGDLNTQNNYDAWNKTILSDKECTNECTDDEIGLVVTAPGQNTKTTSNTVTVQGRVDDRSAIVRVDGVIVSVDSDGEFEKEIEIPEGDSTIVVTAQIDEDSCQEKEEIKVTRERRGRGGSGGRKSSIRCGDGYIDFNRGEECDDGNYRSGDGCSSSCQIEDVAECGNGILEVYEQCDDGNRRDGDGCDAVCNLEDDIVKEKIKKIQIEKILTERKRPEPLAFTPPVHPPVLPKTGATINQCFAR